MKREAAAESAPLVVPAVVSLTASSRRTLKHGDTFAMFDDFGDAIEVLRDPSGLFHHDTRHLSRLYFTVEGHRPLILSSTVQPDNVVLDVDLTNPDLFDGERLILAKDTFHIGRSKFLWNACCYEIFTVTSYADQPVRLRCAIDFAVDFADLFEIRGYRRTRRGAISSHVIGGSEVHFVYGSLDGVPRSTRLCFTPAPTALDSARAEFEIPLAARQRRTISATVQCLHTEHHLPVERRFFGALRQSRRSNARERAALPEIVTSNTVFNTVLSRSTADLAMLMTETPHGPYPYAGVPWFSTAFGRDGILTALEMLWLDPSLARGVLRFLSAHQATREDAGADMEPGKILHEVRECELARLGEVPFARYYGSVDSTPLFIVLAGLYWQRSRDAETLDLIWPGIKRALEWMERYGDRDGDGFIEYGRRSESGLRNQGWKDSEDAIFHADGTLAEPPIALCEVQGYAFLALRLAARLAADRGETDFSRELYAKAQQLQNRFEAAFWCEELGTYALALDGSKRPCAVRSSNAGQLLFTGIARAERASRVAKCLLGPEFFTGWGVRTIGAGEKRFNPTSYHNGSVWPHDNALIGLGLARYGHSREVLALTSALFDAAAHMHLRRLPELFCGFERKRGKAPTLYPVACAPQAWAACAPMALLQACLGIEIDCAGSMVRLREPRLPAFLDWLCVRRLQVGESRLDLQFQRHDASVSVNLLSREGDAEVEVML